MRSWHELADMLEGAVMVDTFWCKADDGVVGVYGVTVYERDGRRLYCWADPDDPAAGGYLTESPPKDRIVERATEGFVNVLRKWGSQ